MRQSLHSGWKFWAVLGSGVALALTLCAQCVRTYWYTDAVLAPQQAEREAERQAGALGAAARSAGTADVRALGPVLEHAVEAAGERVWWMRIVDSDGNPVAQGGKAGARYELPKDWQARLERHESAGGVVKTAGGKALVAVRPFRMPRPPRNAPAEAHQTERRGGARGAAYGIEVAIPLKAVEGGFAGLRKNLIIGMIASMALFLAVGAIAWRTPQYLRGRYLEGELELARRVQRDLQPHPAGLPAGVAFAASAMAADHVGGDFYDLFEAGAGKTAIVLGDVSGKGVPAALLVSVLQGAIRSSTCMQHEAACERINGMLCELTARARFATLFWGVYDAATGVLRYVNAGHGAPMLVRHGRTRIVRLEQGGPVLGLLPGARYEAGSVEIERGDSLVLYSDGIPEAADRHEEEFGEARIEEMIGYDAWTPEELCERIMKRVRAFASGGPAPDDRTLMVVRFPPPAGSVSQLELAREAAAA